MDAARLLADRRDMLVDHVGAALDPALGRAAQATMRAQPRYRWLGGLSHGQSLRRIRAAHVLVQMSRAEGGAHTIAEAVRNGTPVIATRVPGNVGMLGRAYAGYVPAGDAAALAAMLARCRDEPAFLEKLRLQCAARARRFEPRIEAAALLRLVRSLPVPRQPRGRRTP
jgi:glycosyltransferase involved in cell wall biosynthesis